jgi:hypothetical protein
MKKIPTASHGVLDYLVGGTLALAPQFFGFPQKGPASIVPRLLGSFSTKYSLMTEYEMGIIKKLPMRAHLGLDIVAGATLAVSPWLMGFRRRDKSTWLPHVLVGALEIAIAALSESKTPSRHAVERIRRVQSRTIDRIRQELPSVA